MRVIRFLLPLLAVAFVAAACASQPAGWDQAASAPTRTRAVAPAASTSSIDAVIYGPVAHAAPRVPLPVPRQARGLFTEAATAPEFSLPPATEQRGLFAMADVAAVSPSVADARWPFMTAAAPPAAPSAAAPGQPKARVMAAAAPPPPAPPAPEQSKTLFMAAAAPPASAPAPEQPQTMIPAAAAPAPEAADAFAAQDAPPEVVASTPVDEHKPYTLDSGDRLRIVVFGQDGLSNSYLVDASGYIAMPLIGSVSARGATTGELSDRISEKLRQGYVKDPHVAVEVEAYRPFFILGEVTQPGQYPYVADMTVETAIAIAGGFGPRAYRKTVTVTRATHGKQVRMTVPTSYSLRPGDTVNVQERWF